MTNRIFSSIAGGCAAGMLLTLVSCAPPSSRQAYGYQPVNPPVPAKPVTSGTEIILGMSRAQVTAAWGAPENVVREVRRNGDVVERWTYLRAAGRHPVPTEVTLVNDRVTEVTARAEPLAAPVVPGAPAGPQARTPASPENVLAGISGDVDTARRYLEQSALLGLTPAQTQSLGDIRRQYQAVYGRTLEQARADQVQLNNLASAPDPDPMLIQNALDDIARLRQNLASVLIEADRNARDILTEEQKQLLRAGNPPR